MRYMEQGSSKSSCYSYSPSLLIFISKLWPQKVSKWEMEYKEVLRPEILHFRRVIPSLASDPKKVIPFQFLKIVGSSHPTNVIKIIYPTPKNIHIDMYVQTDMLQISFCVRKYFRCKKICCIQITLLFITLSYVILIFFTMIS